MECHNTATSHYPAAPTSERVETRTLCVLVDNEPGVLARVIGLFAGRGYNIDSLTVSETEHEKHLSRITIVTRGTPMVLEQIKNQLDRLVPVHRVIDLTSAGPAIARELAMVKVRGTGEQRIIVFSWKFRCKGDSNLSKKDWSLNKLCNQSFPV